MRRSPTFACIHCGAALRRVRRGPHLVIRCPRCRYRMYDYPRACAGLMVVRGRDVLVLRRAQRPKLGWLDTPGGFVEPGETFEGAARRELREETGLMVGRADWLGLYWDRYYLQGFGFFPTMNFYFIARWRSGTPRPSDDAASAEWLPLARVRGERFAWKHLARVIADTRRWVARGQRAGVRAPGFAGPPR